MCRAACRSSAGSGAGSSLCADGLAVQVELHRLCASTHPETEERGTLQHSRDEKQGKQSGVNGKTFNMKTKAQPDPERVFGGFVLVLSPNVLSSVWAGSGKPTRGC